MKRCLMLAQVLIGSAASASHRCVFMHGLGMPNSSAPTEIDTDDYWGGDSNIIRLTPFCSSRTYIHQDTVTRAWDNAEMHKAVCEAALGEGSNDTVIRDTVLFAHSMGNLIFADAIRQGACSLDTSSHFVSIAAPWYGSKASQVLEEYCSNSSAGEVLHWLAHKLHRCDADRPGSISHAYESLEPTYPAFEGLAEFAAQQVSFAMCGHSPYGLTSVYSAAMEGLASAIGFGEQSDGMVPLSSCLLPGKAYDTHWQSAFYSAGINHIDGTLRSGDGSLGSSRQPSQWVSSLFTKHTETVLV
eukprot:CAMPEP_0115200778 /NCGR_PEP_ID=MMETSP0270-20121206/17292_1 /TAXON_ID=71861 /ORGANISM="Scrippsiella trochoidea, Strain CCMP3099" /LENGTH=299 /DNA_ID=CAMNT_0002614183 /DNA_START=75 /DNA_END=974 /DNA_ORIENTATION=+